MTSRRSTPTASLVRRSAAFTVVVGLAAAACSSSAGSAKIARADVEKKAVAALTAKVGVRPKSISCPTDLAATKGATEQCVLTAPNGDTAALTVTVSSASGGHYRLAFQVGTTVTPAPAGG